MTPRTGKKTRPKTAIKGKRYRCAKCRKRSPKPVKTPAPWYCQNCLKQIGDQGESADNVVRQAADANLPSFESREACPPQSRGHGTLAKYG
jgi:hypothetical protein